LFYKHEVNKLQEMMIETFINILQRRSVKLIPS